MHIDHLRSDIQKAMDSVAAAAPHAHTDAARPTYHFLPPANWMNDPNGTIYHDGYYHLFYQHNPFADTWGDIHWGHARSADLVHWQELPIALWPSHDLDEGHCFSGCAAINGNGIPLLYYTSVGRGRAGERRPNQQWIATGDEDWLRWQKYAGNPYLALGKDGTPEFDPEWRDPFIFQAGARRFMVVGATKDDKAGVVLFESADGQLLDWQYRGWLYHRPRTEVRFFECPNFFALEDKWILLTSPYTPIQYAVGSYNLESLTFEPDLHGTLDYGIAGDSPNFYASNIFWTPENKCVLVGWVRGFPPDRGWNGCMSLPRRLSLNAEGQPIQQPISQLQSLRGRETRYETLSVTGTRQLPECRGNTFECRFSVTPEIGSEVTIAVGQDTNPIIVLSNQLLSVAGTTVPLDTSPTQSIDLHLFIDRSVVELFACGGAIAVTRIIPAPDANSALHLSATRGNAIISNLTHWHLQV